MGYYSYRNTLRFLFIHKLNVFSNNHIVPFVDFINVFVSLKDLISYDEYSV